MAKLNLTDRTLQALKPAPEGKHTDYWDNRTPGLAVRVSDTGRKTFVLVGRFGGSKNPTRRSLGAYGVLTLADAREKAREWLALIDRGKDPTIEAEKAKRAAQRALRTTVERVVEDFVAEKLKHERKGYETEQDLRREILPALGKRPITEIEPLDIVDIVKRIAKKHPYQAHNVLGTAKRLFGWAVDQHRYGLTGSPCDRLKARSLIGERKGRKRVLNDAELRAFWQTATALAYPYGAAAQLLLLTGCRHEEVTGARWRELNPELVALLRRDDADNIDWSKVSAGIKLWTVPAARFKSDRDHVAPLTDEALAVLATIPHFEKGDHLFSTTFGEKPTLLSSKVKAKFDAALGADDWVFHDLRRSVRTRLGVLKVQDAIAELALGHARKGLAGIYDQGQHLDEIREAMARWAIHLRGILEPRPDKVVPLRSAV